MKIRIDLTTHIRGQKLIIKSIELKPEDATVYEIEIRPDRSSDFWKEVKSIYLANSEGALERLVRHSMTLEEEVKGI